MIHQTRHKTRSQPLSLKQECRRALLTHTGNNCDELENLGLLPAELTMYLRTWDETQISPTEVRRAKYLQEMEILGFQ